MRKFQSFILYFLLYSFVGWFYEVFLEVVIYQWGYSDRGVLQGPYCVVYGFGAILLLLLLIPLKEKRIKLGKINITPFLVFLGILLITTTVELIASYIMEAITGSFMWDYSNFWGNYQGRIALNTSLRFGIGGMVFLYLFQPLFDKLTGKMSEKVLTILSSGVALLLICDTIYTFFIK